MNRMIFRACVAASLVAIGTPAAAVNWVRRNASDPVMWIDLDSVVRSGTLVTYLVAGSRVPGSSPAVSGYWLGPPHREGIDCATRQIHGPLEGGSFGPSWDDEEEEYYSDYSSDGPFQRFCR